MADKAYPVTNKFLLSDATTPFGTNQDKAPDPVLAEYELLYPGSLDHTKDKDKRSPGGPDLKRRQIPNKLHQWPDCHLSSYHQRQHSQSRIACPLPSPAAS